MGSLPTGTVTFLFTDLEGSTRLWEEHPDAMQAALARHDEILRHAIESHNGYVVKTTGDGFHAAFATAPDAIDAAVDAQLALRAEPWDATGPLLVRMGIHTGAAELRDGDYYGAAVNRGARLMSVAHGGQILASLATNELLRDAPTELVHLGEHHLRDLDHPEHIFQVIHDGLPREFPPLRSVETLSGNLRAQVTSFVGRGKELGEIAEELQTSRIVTLTGVGGAGKTRLAVEVAARIADRYPGGVWLCELAPVRDPDAVGAAAAAALQVPVEHGETATTSLINALVDRELLLVLDNCEHLIGAAAELVDAITRTCPRVSILATSREALGVAGERSRPVPSLAVPSADSRAEDVRGSEAVQLFEDRARAVDASFTLTDDNAAAVAELCRRLDGIPLAIELAATRVRAMQPAEIARRLDERFRLLTGGNRTALERHQTLRATIDWSYDLLSADEQLVFQRASVFRGGFTLESIEAVAADDTLGAHEVGDTVLRLLDKSMLTRVDTTQGSRYDILESMRDYARDKLFESGDAERVRARHADRFLELSASVAQVIVAGDHDDHEWTVELENAATAFGFLLGSGHGDDALALFDRYGVLWGTKWGWRAALAMIRAGLDAAADPSAHERRHQYAQAARFAAMAGAFDQVLSFADDSARAAAEAGEPLHPAALWSLGMTAFYRGDTAVALDWLTQCVAAARADDTGSDLSFTLAALSEVLIAVGRLEDGIRCAEELLELARSPLENPARGVALILLANAYHDDDRARADRLFEHCVTELQVRGGELTANVNGTNAIRAALYARRIQDPRAVSLFRQGLRMCREIGSGYGIASALEGLAEVVASRGDAMTAAHLLGAGDRLRAAMNAEGRPVDIEVRDATAARLRDDLGARELERARSEGRVMPTQAAIALAFATTQA